jgi:hypothetical protein
MLTRMLVLTVLCAWSVATAQADAGPRHGTADAGTKGTTVPDRPAAPPAGAHLPAPRTQTSTPVGTGSETPPPARATQPAPSTTHPEVPPPSQPPSPAPH